MYLYLFRSFISYVSILYLQYTDSAHFNRFGPKCVFFICSNFCSVSFFYYMKMIDFLVIHLIACSLTKFSYQFYEGFVCLIPWDFLHWYSFAYKLGQFYIFTKRYVFGVLWFVLVETSSSMWCGVRRAATLTLFLVLDVGRHSVWSHWK